MTNPAGPTSITVSDKYTFAAPPTVAAVGPTSGSTLGGYSVVITGTNLSTATAVSFGAPASAASPSTRRLQITATAPAGSLGTVDVTITTAGGTSATGSSDQFTYVAAPSVSAVSPAAGPIAGGYSVVITGGNFTGASAVSFGGTPASSFTFNSDTQITATDPAEAAGTVDVIVTTFGGGSSAISAGDQFTFAALPRCLLAQAPPRVRRLGTIPSIITGVNLANGDERCRSAATPRRCPLPSTPATQITATVPAVAAGTVDVLVTTPGGTSTAVAGDKFTFVTPPVVSSLSLSQGATLGDYVIVVTGSGFTPATAVSFGTTPAISFTVNSDTQITATVPAHSAGTVDVTVTATSATFPRLRRTTSSPSSRRRRCRR